jgi:hypothetical protein
MASRDDVRQAPARRALIGILAAAVVAVGVAPCGGSDDDGPPPPASGSLSVGAASEDAAEALEIDDEPYAEQGIGDTELVTTARFVQRLRAGDVDIAVGDLVELLAAADKGRPLADNEILLLGVHSAEDGLPAEGIATTADFLDGHVDLVSGFIAAQLEAREGQADETDATPHHTGEPEPAPDLGFTAAGMDAVVAEAQANGRLAPRLRWRDHFNVEALNFAQEEAGLSPSP